MLILDITDMKINWGQVGSVTAVIAAAWFMLLSIFLNNQLVTYQALQTQIANTNKTIMYQMQILYRMRQAAQNVVTVQRVEAATRAQ